MIFPIFVAVSMILQKPVYISHYTVSGPYRPNAVEIAVTHEETIIWNHRSAAVCLTFKPTDKHMEVSEFIDLNSKTVVVACSIQFSREGKPFDYYFSLKGAPPMLDSILDSMTGLFLIDDGQHKVQCDLPSWSDLASKNQKDVGFKVKIVGKPDLKCRLILTGDHNSNNPLVWSRITMIRNDDVGGLVADIQFKGTETFNGTVPTHTDKIKPTYSAMYPLIRKGKKLNTRPQFKAR